MAIDPSSHLVLARKWRPERFDDLVGQEHVTRTLVQALKTGRIAHAFLFAGIRGVGKTTAARILARCLDCAQGPTPEPCGSCAACVEIRTGSALDVVEIDGATYRKIDDARAIIENLGYRPARDRFKIYIIDEAHQLTDQAFNALLKTLEEPPPHVKFILATTEPQKMPETILSRLQRYDFRRIPFAVILSRLRELAGREAIEIDEPALSLLAREASGSMRDAERMLETAIASLGEKVGETELAAILGVASRTRIFDIIGAILAKDPAFALSAVRELNQRGANLESLGRDILEIIRNLAVVKLPASNAPSNLLADLPDQEVSELNRLATGASARDLMRLFRLMADTQEQLVTSPYPDLMLEMTMIRMATLAPVMDADELLRAIRVTGASGGGARDTGDGGGGQGRAQPGETDEAASPRLNLTSFQETGQSTATTFIESAEGSSATASSSTVTQASSSPPLSEIRIEAPGAAALRAGSKGTRRIPLEGEVKADAPRRAAALSTPPASAPAAQRGGGELPDLRDFIRSRRAALAGFMEQGASLALDGEMLKVTPRSDIYIRYLTDNRTVISELASELYGRRIRAEISVGLAPPAAFDATAVAKIDAPAAAGVDAANGLKEAFSKSDSEGGSGTAVAFDTVGDAGAAVASESPAMPPPRTPADAKQQLYADPVVRRIFQEFDARLVEVKVPKTQT